jgi:hypothetical protein
VPLIAEMVNLPIPPAYPALPFSPDQRRKRLFAALRDGSSAPPDCGRW